VNLPNTEQSPKAGVNSIKCQRLAQGERFMKRMFLAVVVMVVSIAAHASSVDEILDWGDRFRAQYGNELKGKTPDGYECILSSWDKSFKGLEVDNRDGSPTQGQTLQVDERSAYLSLGSNQGSASGRIDWIGFGVNPGIAYVGKYEVKALEVTPTMVHMNVVGEEIVGNFADGLKALQNDLVISMGENGEVLRAVGTSSYWTTVVCTFPDKSR
jgi:hypothetical protein